MSYYFSYLPDIYVGSKQLDSDKITYVKVKNIFRRIKAREDLGQYITFLEQYQIGTNERPYNVASKVYGDSRLDWVVLLTNNIIDVYEEWPRTPGEFDRMLKEKYGPNKDGLHHYETAEIKDPQGKIILRGGLIVQSNFRYKMPDGTYYPNPIIPVSNFEYEDRINEDKRGIYLLKAEFIDQFIYEFMKLTEYDQNEELEDPNTKKTPLSNVANFLDY